MVTGTRVDPDDAANALFTSGALGDGCAVRVTGNTVFAPLNAQVDAFPETGYDITLKIAPGLRLQIKITTSAHRLMGEKCQKCVTKGAHVKAGEPLMHVNPVWLKSKGIDPLCFITLRGSASLRALVPATGKHVVALEDSLFTLYW
ncbi:PTS glucose transporter subunit IIA [Alteromonas ponticola]|uniref:PTS system glucose-specific EIIA component n=1 Tax=Alteromonas ponticola TaxID=2720613 RepID=A0ABX1R111_9ALTE|nr:PTS glucose transporter subunit IIA [Alteromonas ponticola]